MLGLQVRYTVRVVALALGVAIVVGGLTLEFCGRLIRRLHTEYTVQTAALVASKAGYQYTQGQQALAELADQLVRNRTVIFVAFMDPAGKGLAAAGEGLLSGTGQHLYTPTPAATLGAPRYVAAVNGVPPHLDITYPVRAPALSSAADGPAAPLVGYVRLGVSLQRTFTDATSTVNLLMGLAVIVLAATCFTGFLLVRWFIAPLRELAGTMDRLAEGDLQARCTIRRRDEIGELAEVYNLMADRLAQKHAEITLLNTELEERVQQRTRQLRDLAARDPLTGLYNRRHFGEVVQSQFAAARRYGQNLSCMMIDMDDFKGVNDRLGHQCGDELLIMLGIAITTELRRCDIAARYGGDEFIILLPGTDVDEAATLAQRMLGKLRRAVAEQVRAGAVSFSAGVAGINDPGVETAEDLVRMADRAMYEAKSSGKSRIVAAPAALS